MYTKLDTDTLVYMFTHYGYVFECDGDAGLVIFSGGEA